MKGIKDILKSAYFRRTGLVTSMLNWLVTPFKHLYFWGILIGVIAIGYTCWFWAYWGDEKDTVGLLRVYFFGLGGILALGGLVLAIFRQVTLDRQTRTAQGQLFNDRLGRGVELLANEKVSMRRTGIKVLADLTKTVTDEQKNLIIEIIYDFIVSNSQKQFNNGKLVPAKSRHDRIDIELGIEVLFEQLKIRGELRNSKFSLSDLDLRELNLEYFNFERVSLSNTDLLYANLSNANLSKLWLVNANFSNAELPFADFSNAYLPNANLSYAGLFKANLSGAILSGADLSYADLSHADLSNADLSNVDLSNAYLKGVDLNEVKSLTQSQLDGIIYEIGIEPKNLPSNLTLPKDRAYKVEFGTDDYPYAQYFVKSDKLWSEQPVREWRKNERNKRLKKKGKARKKSPKARKPSPQPPNKA